MDYNIQVSGNTARITLGGRLTFSHHREYRDVLAKLMSHKAGIYEFDLSGVDFIDSAGLGMLLIAKQHAEAAQAQVVLKNPAEEVQRMLKVAKFEKMFNIT